jgi:hypothetical protein
VKIQLQNKEDRSEAKIKEAKLKEITENVSKQSSKVSKTLIKKALAVQQHFEQSQV